MTPKKLTADLQVAGRAADEAVKGQLDNGSCNMDMVFIPVGKTSPVKRKSKAYDKAIEEAGFSGFRTETTWWKGYLIIPNVAGSAYVRLKACEIMAKQLTELGWNACVYYQMD